MNNTHPSHLWKFQTALSICFLLIVLAADLKVFACSWDYLIWTIRNKDADPLYRFVRGERAGYIDRTGKIVIEPLLSFYGNGGGEFHEGLLNQDLNGKFIDTTGKVVVVHSLQRVWDFSEGLAAAMPEGEEKWGYIDRNGRWVIPPQFATYPQGHISSFADGLAYIKVKNKYGYIDRSGKFVIEPSFLYGESFSEGYAPVIVEGPCARITSDGPCGDIVVIPDQRLPIDKVEKCKWTFINKAGRIISEDRFDEAENFSEGLAAVRKDEKWGFIDTSGKLKIPCQFEKASAFSDGLACVKQEDLYGYIDKDGQIVIPPRFDFAESFSEGLAVVASPEDDTSAPSGPYYINKSGKQAFAGAFAVASPFFKGLAHVKIKGTDPSQDRDIFRWAEFAYIDVTGKKVFTYAAGRQ
jgi:hypothetical protein